MIDNQYAIASLQWNDCNNNNQSLDLGEETISIGRSKDNDIAILDKRISRYHAEITYDGQDHIINDLESINGVLINDVRIKNGEQLSNGTKIKIGPIQLTYRTLKHETKDLLQQIRTTTIVVPDKQYLPHLEVISGTQIGVIFELELDEITIGRSNVNNPSDFMLKDRAVSRPHAKITKLSDKYLITDLGSANGTILNGEQISEPILLSDKDAIEIGETEMIFHVGN